MRHLSTFLLVGIATTLLALNTTAQSNYLSGIDLPTYFAAVEDNSSLTPEDGVTVGGLSLEGTCEFNVFAFTAAVNTGSVLLPLDPNEGAVEWREFTLTDRATGQIWDSQLNQFLLYDLYSFVESDGDLAAAAVLSNGDFGIVQFNEDRDPSTSFRIEETWVIYSDGGSDPSRGLIASTVDTNLASLLSTAGAPPPFSSLCEETLLEQEGNGPQTAEVPASQVVTRNGVRSLNNAVSYSEGIDAMIPPNMTLSMHALLYTGLANGVMRPELGLVFRPQMAFRFTDAMINNLDSYSGPPALTDTTRWFPAAMEQQLLAGNPNFQVDLGMTFVYGGGGVATGSSGCSTASGGIKYRGVTRLDRVFELFDVMTFVHESGHQLGARHTFNANETDATIVATQRTAASAYEAGSGYTIMAYMHNCPETYITGPGTFATTNHFVPGRVSSRIRRTPIWEDFYANIRLKFHTHSMEQINSFVTNSCNAQPVAAAIGPNLVLDLQHGTSELALTGAKNVPLGKSVMLAVAPEANTEYRWHQMDLGPADAWPDITAVQNDPVGPKVAVNGPTTDGLSFIPPRDNLLSGYFPNHHYSTLCANPGDNYNFRVQGNRYIPMGATAGGAGQAALSASGLVGINCVSAGQDFELTAGPWDLSPDDTWAITELGSGSDEALYQFEIDWNVAGTTGAPFNSDKVDIYRIVGEDASTLELLFADFPNEGGAVLELPPSPVLEDGSIAEQRIMIKLPDEVWFDLSDPFQIFYAGCTDPGFPTYDPQANIHDASACTYGPWPLVDGDDPLGGDMCKDMGACNYNADAQYHHPESCYYPACEFASALNFSIANIYEYGSSCSGGECVYDVVPCDESIWLDPDDASKGWGFHGGYDPYNWRVINTWYNAMINNFPDGYAQMRINNNKSRLHAMVGLPPEYGPRRVGNFNIDVPYTGTISFDWQVVEAVQSNNTNFNFWLNGEWVNIDKGPQYTNNWVVGDGVEPATGSATVAVQAGDLFDLWITTDAPEDAPVGMILSNFRFDYNLVSGCMDSQALNYNPLANCEQDNACTYPWGVESGQRCHDPAACNYTLPLATTLHNPFLCEYPGCVVSSAANYNPNAGCPGPCCFTGECDLEEGEDGPILWYDVNDFWPEYDPLPDFEEVMYINGGLVMTSPQTAEQVEQTVAYSYTGQGITTVSFMYAWVPGIMSLPGDMLSPARVEVWKEGVMVYESALDENAGEALVPGGDFPNQAYGLPLATWPGDPFNMDPFLADGSLVHVSETLPSFEGEFRAMSIDITENSEVRIIMASDSQDMVEDDTPCRLYVTGMRVDQNCGSPGTTGPSTPATPGCMDPTACNYNPLANINDGSCGVAGCMDPDAINFSPNAVCNTACLYEGDCATELTPDSSIAYGFNGAFAPGYASVNSIPDGLLSVTNNLMVITGPDEQFGGASGTAIDHEILWVATEDMDVQFAYAAASWDTDYQYDQAYYRWNGVQVTLDEFAGDPIASGTWVVDHPDWNPGPDYVLPTLDEVPYEGFVDQLTVDLHLLKDPIPLQAGDTLALGVHSNDNIYGEVVLAVMGLVWTAHCPSPPESLEIVGCKDSSACNFDPEVTEHDPATCYYPGEPCNDGDACTYEDVINGECTCVGIFIDGDGDGVCDVEDECPDNPDLTQEGTCGCEPPASCLPSCEVDADGDGVCAENDCDDNDPMNPDPETGECTVVCGCLDPMAANYNAAAVCSAACVYDDACNLIKLGVTADGLPVGFGFRGAYADSYVAWNYADPWQNQAAGDTDIALELLGDADQTHLLRGPSTLTQEGSFGFRMPVSGTFAFTWSFVHGSADDARSLAWVEVGNDRTYLPITEAGEAPDASTVLPADWYAPMPAGDLAGADHATHFETALFDAEDWCGINLPIDVSTLPDDGAVNWSSATLDGEDLPWTAGEALGEYAQLLFPTFPAGFTGMDGEWGGGYHKPVVVRANAGEFVSFHIGYAHGYSEGATGALLVSSPMWLNNCGAEPCGSTSEPLCPADIDGSGMVTISDLLLVLAEFGEACP